MLVSAALTVFLTVVAAGCGGGGQGPQDSAAQRAGRAGADGPPAGIPVYPGAQKIELEAEEMFAGHGVRVFAYQTNDPLSGVYSFYATELGKSGFDAPGSYDGSNFMFQVMRGGSDVAMINGSVEEGKTLIVIIQYLPR